MSSSELRREIEDADRAFESNSDRQDADGMGTLYTEDGQLLPPGTDVVSGRNDITAFWQEVFDVGIANARIKIVVGEHDHIAIEIGRFTLSDTDNETVDHGTFLVIWKHDDGEWKLHRDIWNSNVSDGR
jgi:uncharacterized protein (TIGR02246 family)